MIGSSLMVELAEEEFRQEEFINICDEAAHYVVSEKMPRKEAFNHAKDLAERRKDPDNMLPSGDEIIYTDDELNEPELKITNQIKVISQELQEQFE
jgi:hypothetical protein